MKESTEKLQEELNNTKIETYLDSHDFEDFDSLNFPITLKNLLESRSLKPTDIIKTTPLSKSYVYAVLSGKKAPSRDKIISICIAIKADLTDCNSLLKSASYRFLHPKSKRDSIIIFSLNKGLSLAEVNIELERAHLELLD